MDADLADGLWLSLSGVADYLGVSRQAVSKRAAEFEAAGKLTSRRGKGGTKEVNLAQYLLAANALGDPAREQAAETSRYIDDESTPSGDSRYRDAAAREKALKADLAEIELKTRLGELVPVTDLSSVIGEAAETIVAVLERLPAQADAIASAVAKDGAGGARAMLKQIVRGQRQAIADALRQPIATIHGEAAAQAACIAEGDNAGAVVLWGDLDPAG